MAQPCTFIDVTARATRTSEVPGASFLDGMNNGSCQCGIGISKFSWFSGTVHLA